MLEIKRLFVANSSYKAINRLLPHLSLTAPPITLEELHQGLRQSNFYLFVAEDDTKGHDENLVGMALIYFIWRPEGWTGSIHCVVVDEEYRGQHIGQILIEKLIQTAKEFAQTIQKKFKVYLTSRPSRVVANSMYQKLGFRLVAKADDEWGTNLYKIVIMP